MNQQLNNLLEVGEIVLEDGISGHHILFLSIIGEIEGHNLSSERIKTTKYEHLLPILAKAQDKQEVLADMVFDRLEYPYDLTDKNKDEYKDYMMEHFAKWSEILVEQDAIERLQFLSKQNLWSREMLDIAIMEASEKKRGERA